MVSNDIPFPDLTDVDPYDGWPEYMFDHLDRVYSPATSEVEFSDFDVVYLGSDVHDDKLVLYFSRGYKLVEVTMARSFDGIDIGPVIPQCPEVQHLALEHLEMQHALEFCQTFMHSIEFGHVGSNSELTFKDRSTGIRRDVTMFSPSLSLYEKHCPLHVIDQDMVRITRWIGPGGYQDGMWDQLPVDVRLPQSAEEMSYVRGDVAGFIKLGNLPYAYRYLAALQQGERITGVICESREGRPIRFSDKEKLTRALRDIEERGLVYMDVRETHLAISYHDNQVKFVYPHRLFDLNTLPDPREREQLIHRRHYQAADNLFSRLQIREMKGLQCMTMLSRYWKSNTFVLPRSSTPQAFLNIVAQWPDEWPSFACVLERLRDKVRVGPKQIDRKKQDDRQTTAVDFEHIASSAEESGGVVVQHSTTVSLLESGSDSWTPDDSGKLLWNPGYLPPTSPSYSPTPSSDFLLVENMETKTTHGDSISLPNSQAMPSPTRPHLASLFNYGEV